MGHPLIGVFIGSALGASALGNVPALDVLRSMQGSIGFAVGYYAGTFANELVFTDYTYLPYTTGALVPMLAGGTVDRSLLGLVAGGVIGGYLFGFQLTVTDKGADKPKE